MLLWCVCVNAMVLLLSLTGDLVLDIGTGTGLLAMLAAEALRDASPDGSAPGQVVACEVFPPMASLAQRVVDANGFLQRIEVISKRSDELKVAPSGQAAPAAAVAPAASSGADPAAPAAALARRKQAQPPAADLPRKVDLIVTEIYDSELLGEGLLPTMRHAVRHLLRPGGKVVPSSARVYGQLVECSVLQQCQSVALLPSSTQGDECGSGKAIKGNGGCLGGCSRTVVLKLAFQDGRLLTCLPPSQCIALPCNNSSNGQGFAPAFWHLPCLLHLRRSICDTMSAFHNS